MNILIVDDEYGPRESLRMILKKKYKVYTADSGEKAIDILNRFPIDMITLDIKMPGMNGIDLLKHIRENDEYMDIVMITGYGTLDYAIEGIRQGVMDFVSKPFSVPDILSIVEKAEKRKKLRQSFNSENFKNRISKLEMQLSQTKQLSRVGDMAALYAHEIKNPLGAISLRAQASLQAIDSKNQDEISRHLESIMSQTERISKITDGLLRMAHPKQAEKEVTDVHTIIEEMIDFFVIQLKTKKITIQKIFDRSIPPVLVDTDQLFQVFLNIALNAFKVLDKDGIFRIATSQSDYQEGSMKQMIRIDFCDNGPGIPEDVKPYIFEPFFTTNKKTGSGLGLHACKNILQSHNGVITVESAVGKGAVFSVYLPPADEAKEIANNNG